MMLLAFLLVSIQGMLAQNTNGTTGNSGTNNTSITPIELLNFEQGKVQYTLPSSITIPDGSVPTWKVDDQEIKGTSVSEDGMTLTLPLSKKIRNIVVTFPATDTEAEKTFTFQANPKEYSQDYTNVVANGQTHFYADSYHPYKDGTQGDGSKDKPYLISNDMELARLAHEVTNGYKDKKSKVYSQTYFKLTQDIDLSRGIWTPIGSWKYINNKNFNDYSFFAGKLDGDGHSIKNMLIEWINESGYEASWDLFSRLNGTESSEKGFASVTNLIIDDATLQKKPGFNPVGNGVIKLGTIAGDLTQNAETSNIIIRNSKITDNKEKYTTSNKYRIGGIIGYLDNSATLRIYNITSPTTPENMQKELLLRQHGWKPVTCLSFQRTKPFTTRVIRSSIGWMVQEMNIR